MSKLKYTPKELKRKAKLYFAYCDEKFDAYVLSGFCIYAGISTTTLERYRKKKEYASAVRYIYDNIETHIVKNTLNGSYNSGFAQFYLKAIRPNKFVVTEKSQVKQNITGNVGVSPIAGILDQMKKRRDDKDANSGNEDTR